MKWNNEKYVIGHKQGNENEWSIATYKKKGQDGRPDFYGGCCDGAGSKPAVMLKSIISKINLGNYESKNGYRGILEFMSGRFSCLEKA